MSKKSNLDMIGVDNYWKTIMEAYGKVRLKHIEQEPCDEDIEILFNDL